ncbi:hypothetical protein HD806DRAFT_553238 [Xylariaceae sp. AK1471]|nr:hypothetical protein HD806DRAFT_553238 [Xylariaceae sp. AK1471]
MDPSIECPNGHGPMEVISIAIAAEALEELREATNKYLSGPGGFFATEVWKEVMSKNEIAKHKISLLDTVGEKHTDEAAARYEEQRARCWKSVEGIATRFRTQEEEKNAKKYLKGKGNSEKKESDKEKEGNEPGASSKGAEKTTDPLVIIDARKAIAKHIRVCKEEIREKNTSSWSLLSGGLETIDEDYKKARAIVKKAIEAATNQETGESEKVDKEQAERLLKNLRKIWLDARGYFHDAMDADCLDSELEEERELGLIYC